MESLTHRCSIESARLPGPPHSIPAWYNKPQGEFHIKRTGTFLVPFQGSKRGFSTSWGVNQPKKSIRGTFVTPSRVLSQKNMTGDNELV